MKLAAGVVLAAVVLASCAAPDDAAPGAVEPAREPAGSPAAARQLREGPLVEPPSAEELPPLDRSRAIVDLEEVAFDTFDGGLLPLAEASPERVEDLRDRIPPIPQPRYQRAADADYLKNGDLALGYVTAGGEAFAYPVRILNFHEIINEEFDGVPVLISYCPLCRSGVVYDRRLDGETLAFGNTSALFDSDLVMYDHQTNSYWWQIAGRAIVGTLSGAELKPLPSTTTAWADWRDRHPDSWVLSRDTGFDRPYERDPFLGFRERLNDGEFPFPVDEQAAADRRLDPAEEVLGVVLDNEARAYPLRTLGDTVVNDELAGVPLVVFSRAQGPTGTAFDRRAAQRTLTFELRDDDRIKDEETGSTWTVDGLAVDGPLEGTQLDALPSRFSFWFAFLAAFPEADTWAG